MKVVVTGSRDWLAEDLIRVELNEIAHDFGAQNVTLIHGGARGVDTIAAAWARQLGMTVVEYRADWERFKRSAGIRRNLEMLRENPDLVLAFWDGESRGTEHAIRQASNLGLRTVLVRPSGLREELVP